MGKHLQFTREYWNKLIDGTKTITIRYGRLKDYKIGDIVYVHCGGYVVGKAEITDVQYKKLKDLSDEDALLDGFPSKNKLKEALKKHYPQLKSEDWLTIIRFRWVKLFEEPISSEDFVWKGIKIDVKEIAKKGLEHYSDKLSEKQKKYLELIIKEGSIRKAAMKLGGLHKRGLLRKIIRKILDKLLKDGIIKLEED